MRKEQQNIEINKRSGCTGGSSMGKMCSSRKSTERITSKSDKNYERCEPYCNQAQDVNKLFVTRDDKIFDKERFIDYYSSCISKGR